jgi:hypothetical protein
MYQEVENKEPKPRNATYSKKDRKVVELIGIQEITGSKGSYRVKRDGLMKKTISVQIDE